MRDLRMYHLISQRLNNRRSDNRWLCAEYGTRYLSVELRQDRVRLRLNRIYSIEPIVRAVNRYINHAKRKEQLLDVVQAVKLLSRCS